MLSYTGSTHKSVYMMHNKLIPTYYKEILMLSHSAHFFTFHPLIHLIFSISTIFTCIHLSFIHFVSILCCLRLHLHFLLFKSLLHCSLSGSLPVNCIITRICTFIHWNVLIMKQEFFKECSIFLHVVCNSNLFRICAPKIILKCWIIVPGRWVYWYSLKWARWNCITSIVMYI